jgi:Sec-independent protein secretion pathway component TatC
MVTWKDARKFLAIGSLVIGGVATGLPDLYSKILFAVALGLSNAAIYIKTEE